MKIAQIAPIYERVPPKAYGGTERVVHSLTEELVKRGHEVTLFASGDSPTSASLVSVINQSLSQSKVQTPYGPDYQTMHNIGVAYDMQDKFDIIHDHNYHLGLPTAQLSKKPVIITLHNAFDADRTPLFETLNKPYLVSISHAQTKAAPNLNYIGNVYHGIHGIEKYPFGQTPGKYLLFVGRISKEKGTHFAIKTAMALNMPLIIAAKLDKIDEPYFKKYVKPLLNRRIRWIGPVDEAKRNELMSQAYCVLHPITWPEPFGLTIIESMACGTPVVGFRLGSIPELILHGKTGFVVRDLDSMINAVKKIGKISRSETRAYALKNFSPQKMAEEYEKIYKLAMIDKGYRENKNKPFDKIIKIEFINNQKLTSKAL